MRIAISGVNGLVGSTLKAHFQKNGHEVNEICRHRVSKNSSDIFLDIKNNTVDSQALEGHDVVIHLSGASLTDRSWSIPYKKEILESRVKSTSILVEAIKNLNKRPKIFLCASAIGYYGNHDASVVVNEHSPSGTNFLAEVCREWEISSADLVLFGVRLVHMRFGIVLSKKGGALAKMKVPFYLGVGGKLGSGKQKMSWIALDEIPNIIDFIIMNDNVSGPVNFVSPNAVTNYEFTKTFGKVIHRPTILPVPGFMINIIFGEMGQKLLLEGVHVVPQVLIDAGYVFKFPSLREALKQVL